MKIILPLLLPFLNYHQFFSRMDFPFLYLAIRHTITTLPNILIEILLISELFFFFEYNNFPLSRKEINKIRDSYTTYKQFKVMESKERTSPWMIQMKYLQYDKTKKRMIHKFTREDKGWLPTFNAIIIKSKRCCNI